VNIQLSDEDKQAIYRELLAIPTREDYPQPNITVIEVMEMEGVSRATAYSRLEALVLSGKMKKADSRIKIDGHFHNVYWAASLETE